MLHAPAPNWSVLTNLYASVCQILIKAKGMFSPRHVPGALQYAGRITAQAPWRNTTTIWPRRSSVLIDLTSTHTLPRSISSYQCGISESELGRETHSESLHPRTTGTILWPTQVHLCCPIPSPDSYHFLSPSVSSEWNEVAYMGTLSYPSVPVGNLFQGPLYWNV